MENKGKITISIELENYDEIIEKLENIKKLLQEINKISIHVEA